MTSCTAQNKEKDTYVVIETRFGDITLKLYDDTPRHRDNFLKLVKEGTYNGTLFHRVIENFMIQGGDPTSKNAPAGKQLGTGDMGYTIPAEIVYPAHFQPDTRLSAFAGPDTVPRRWAGTPPEILLFPTGLVSHGTRFLSTYRTTRQEPHQTPPGTHRHSPAYRSG